MSRREISDCDFGHTIYRETAPALGLSYWTHVHEDEAIDCYMLGRLGVPQIPEPVLSPPET